MLKPEEFAEKYLTEGSEEELQERRSEFKTLPAKFIDENTDDDPVKKKSLKDLQQIASEKQYPEDDWKKLKKEQNAHLTNR